MKLAKAIDEAVDGDTIVVKYKAMELLGLSAKSRMCPNKKLTFELEQSN